MNQQSNGKTLELVVFSLADGVSHEEFMGTVDAVSVWAQSQPGFISRELSYWAERDQYVEVVYWETLEEAEQAARLAESSEQCAPMFSKTRMDNMLFLHATSLLTAEAVSPITTSVS